MLVETNEQGLSPHTQERLRSIQQRIHADDLDEATNTAVDLLETLIKMGGDAHMIDGKTGKGFRVFIR